MSLLDLPEELHLSITECVKDDFLASKEFANAPALYGLHSSLRGSGIEALSLTCQMLRRIVLPVLFDHLNVVLSYTAGNAYCESERDSLKANTGALSLVRSLDIKADKHMKECLYRPFIIDALHLMPLLEYITFSWHVIGTDTEQEVLHAINEHPTLKTAFCSHSSAALRVPFPKSAPMNKIALQSVTLKGPNELRMVPILQARGIQVVELRIPVNIWNVAGASWMTAVFPSLQKLSLNNEVLEGQGELQTFDGFLDCHLTTLTSLRIKENGPVDFVLKRFDPALYEAAKRFDMKVGSFWMTKESSARWSVREMDATIHVSAEDTRYLLLEEAIRAIGSLAPHLRTFNLTVSYKGFADPKHITATRYLEDFATSAFSTYFNMLYLTLCLPEEMLERDLLPTCKSSKALSGRSDVSETSYLRTAHSIAAGAPTLDMITMELLSSNTVSNINRYTQSVPGHAQVPVVYNRVYQRVDMFRALVDKEFMEEPGPRRVFKGEVAKVKANLSSTITYYEYVGEGWPPVDPAKAAMESVCGRVDSLSPEEASTCIPGLQLD